MDQARLAKEKREKIRKIRRTECNHKRVKLKDGTIKRLWIDKKGNTTKEEIIRKV